MRRSRQWRWFYIALGAYVVAMSAYTAHRTHSNAISDFKDFWDSGAESAHTGEVPYEQVVQNYLPAFKVMIVPLALMPLPVAAAVFTLLSGGLLALAVGKLAKITTVRKVVPWAVILALTLPFLHDTLAIGQTSLVVLLPIVLMWEFLDRDNDPAAGVSLAIAIILKLVPAVLLIWLLVRGRRRAAAWAVASTVILALALPTFALGWPETVRAHREFARVALVEHSAVGVLTADVPTRAKYSNAALPIVLRRVLTPTDIDPVPGRPPRYVNLATVGPRLLVSLWIVAAGGLLTASIRSSLRVARAGTPLVGTLGAMADFAIWCCLMLLLSPIASTHYLVFMAIPLAPLVLVFAAPYRASATPKTRWAATAGLVWWTLGIVALLSPVARAMGASWFAIAGLWATNLVIVRETPYQPARPIAA